MVFGGSSGVTPVSLQMQTEVELHGSTTSWGSLPSSPITFWIPGTEIPSYATGYIPFYNKPLGVINFTHKPKFIIEYTTEEWQEPDEPFDPDQMMLISEHTARFPETIDFSNCLIINPEVEKIATVTVEEQNIIFTGTLSTYPPTLTLVDPQTFVWNDGYTWISQTKEFPRDLKIGIRFTIKVSPKNGSPDSYIVKTLPTDYEFKPVKQ